MAKKISKSQQRLDDYFRHQREQAFQMYDAPASPGSDAGCFPAAHPRPVFKINDTVYIKSTTTRDLSCQLRQARDNRTPFTVVKVDESATPFQVVVTEPRSEDDDNPVRMTIRFALDELETETIDNEYAAWLDMVRLEDPDWYEDIVNPASDEDEARERIQNRVAAATADWQRRMAK